MKGWLISIRPKTPNLVKRERKKMMEDSGGGIMYKYLTTPHLSLRSMERECLRMLELLETLTMTSRRQHGGRRHGDADASIME